MMQFGNSLAELMIHQEDTSLSGRQLPWILTALCKRIIDLGGHSTKGIFRVPADERDIKRHKSLLDSWSPNPMDGVEAIIEVQAGTLTNRKLRTMEKFCWYVNL